MYRQYFCSGQAMVVAVNVGHGWELARLRWHIFGTSHQAGEARVAAGRQGRITHTLSAAGGFRRGGVAGAEPPHKGGPNRPDRPELQWSVVSSQ